MDDVSDLAEEIAALHRGRGLRRTSLPLGPRLRAALHLDVSVGQVEAQDRVVAALRASASTLPQDLQTVILIASALTSSEPLLGDRLARAGNELDRDARTIRRRLAEANLGVATMLARGSQRPVAMGHAWYIEEFASVTDLRSDRPILVARKLVIPTLGGVAQVTEQFGMAQPRPGGPEPEVEVLRGGELLRVKRHGTNVWDYDVRLTEPTQVGKSVVLEVKVVVPSRDWLVPYSVFTPYKPCRLMEATTHFGSPPAADLAWELPGVIPMQALGDAPLGRTYDPAQQPTVELAFEGLVTGLSYGIAWRWRE